MLKSFYLVGTYNIFFLSLKRNKYSINLLGIWFIAVIVNYQSPNSLTVIIKLL